MPQFVLREYREHTDFETIYKEICAYAEKTTAYHVTGCSYCPSPEQVKEQLRVQTDYHPQPFVAADDQDHPIGIANPYYRDRPGQYYKIFIRLWEKQELTEAVLRRTLENCFSRKGTKMVICKVMGHETALLEACRKIGMEQAGCIPNYFCYEGNLFPEYIMIMTQENWQ